MIEKKHTGKIIALMLLMFASCYGETIGTLYAAGMDYDSTTGYAFLLSLLNIVLASVIMMAIPFICRMVNKDKLPLKKGKRICLWNSIVLFVLSCVLMTFIDVSFIGGVGAVIFYFINKWVFVHQYVIEDMTGYTSRVASENTKTTEKTIDYTKTATYQASQVMGSDIALDIPQEVVAAPINQQPEASPGESLMSRAYRSYVSNNPEERRFFEELLGSEELKAAYLEACERNQREFDKGVHIDFKESYLQFMGVLYDEYFGAPSAPQTPDEEHTPATGEVIPVSIPVVEKSVTLSSNEKRTFCKKCGSAIDSKTKKCSGCGKQYFRAKNTVPIIVLSLLLVGSIGLNLMQHFQGEVAIEKLENEVSMQKTKIASLEKKSSYFDTLCTELSSGKIGTASNTFKASESVIVVDKNETNRKFTLTTSWSGGGTISVDYSGNAAYVSFDEESWDTSTKMTVEPKREGVTAVTFSNDYNLQTFKVIIIVT